MEKQDIEFVDRSMANVTPSELSEGERIWQVLETPRFEYGFRNDSIERQRFRDLYTQIHGMSCSLDDDGLVGMITSIGFAYAGKVYAISEATKQWWRGKLDSYRASGISTAYYGPLYDNCFDECTEAKIISAEMLRALLSELTLGYDVHSDYIALSAGQATELELLQSEILRVWGNSPLETLDELAQRLPLVPHDKVKWALLNDDAFIWNGSDTYVLNDALDLEEEEIADLVHQIDEHCSKSGQVSLLELPLNQYRERNPDFSDTALYTIVYGYVADRYERRDRILYPKGGGQSTEAAVHEFCLGRERCSYEELKDVAVRATGRVRLPEIVDAAQSMMVRVDHDKYVSDNQVSFEYDEIDSVLDRMVGGGFLGLKEISAFGLFPSCGFAWNLYLLESYCRRFSKRYIYRCKSANSSNVGAVTLKTCQWSYYELMTHAVAMSNVKLDKKSVFDFLQVTGYIERKRYNLIDDLLKAADKLRKRG